MCTGFYYDLCKFILMVKKHNQIYTLNIHLQMYSRLNLNKRQILNWTSLVECKAIPSISMRMPRIIKYFTSIKIQRTLMFIYIKVMYTVPLEIIVYCILMCGEKFGKL